ncbi:HAD family hydrolase [Acholeplasma granularum]|uniref:HAD family hydrolase n=1 Tax=Acholeplasma granularum TaxID=264635 RepID=UPI000472F8EC|nr:HAD family hydrolase [Acholeplasma granularum]
MEKHLIAIDLDGTLLNDDSKVPQKNKEVIKKLVEKGHMVVLATGRPFHATIDIYNELDLKTPVITDNGGNIREPKNPQFQIVTDGIQVEIAHSLFNFTKPHLESAFYSYGDHIYAYKYLDRLHNIFMGSQNAKIIHADFNDLWHTPTGMIYLVSTPFMSEFEHFITEKLKGELGFRLWGHDSKHAVYEIYKFNSSKLSAINWVADHFGIDQKNMIAFGDGLNDIEMIKGVNLGIAMPNGTTELKQVADKILEHDNNDAGVGKFLENYFSL